MTRLKLLRTGGPRPDLLLITVVILATSLGAGGEPAAASPSRPYAATSFWNAPLPVSTATDPKSRLYAADIAGQIQAYYGNAAINTTNYSAPVYEVGATVPPTAVKFLNCQNKTWVDPAFLAQVSAVPIPANAVPAGGNDNEMVIWQPSTDTVWELWKAQKRDDGWYACWGGRIQNASSSQGVFAKNYGVAATGLSLLGGMMRIDELQAGQINHALDFSLVRTRSSVYSWPANRTDGWINDTDAIPEGQRFRLDPTVNVDSLNLTPVGKMMATAIQKYGMVLRDKGGSVAFYAENPTPQINAGQANPYSSIFGGKPSYSQLANFPWERLQALPFDYGKDGTQPAGIPNLDVSTMNGYRAVASTGSVSSFGQLADKGSVGTGSVVNMAGTSSRQGYWLATSDGQVHRFGDATNFGSMAGRRLNAPIVGIASRPNSNGYYLLGRDGGVFSFGEAPFFGSTGSMKLNQPVVGMAAVPNGQGYWFVAADGGVFSYGPEAHFLGSTGGLRLNQPIVGMAPTKSGQGYWLVAADGGIFAFGDAPFYGSTGAIHLNKPIVGMAVTATGNGYRFVASDGGIFSFGDATFEGSVASPSAPVVGMTS